MKHLKISRKAILIGAPGGTNSDFLYGVKADLENYKEFLSSPRGGCWYEEEIITIKNATYDKVSAVVHSTEMDYNLIVFSGHGCTYENQRILCLQDANVPDEFLLNNSPRQLIIADTCRTKIGASIGGIPERPQGYLSFDGPDPVIRNLFDYNIQNSPYGKIIVHGTQNGMQAKDTLSGGVFSNCLLHVGHRMQTEWGYSFSTIQEVLKYVSSELKERGSNQIPEWFYEGDLQVPFAVGMPAEQTKDKGLKKILAKNNSSSIGWGEFALGLLVIAAIGEVLTKK